MCNRYDDLDWLKGLGIVLMIASHSGLNTAIHIDPYVNAFYMPMFFFISGYFLHIEKYTAKEFIIKKIRSLIIPYLIWSFFHFALWFGMYITGLVGLSTTPLTMFVGIFWDNNKHFPIAGALWFVTCLFWVNVFSFCAAKYISKKFYITCAVIGGIIGVYYHPFVPWSGDTAFVAGLFYAIGYSVALVTKNNILLPRRLDYRIRLLFMMTSLCVCCLGIGFNGNTNFRECFYGNMPIAYIPIALMCIFLWWTISSLICENQHLKRANGIVIWIGRKSMPFLCLNQLIFAVLSRILPQNVFSQVSQTCLVIALLSVFTMTIDLIDKKTSTNLYGLFFGR